MKKGLVLSIMLVLMLVLTACGQTPQEKFADTYSKALDVPDQYTQKMSFKIDNLESDDIYGSEASTIEMLKKMQLDATTSIDKKAEKSYVAFNLSSDGALNFDLEVDVLMNDKTGEAYIPLDTIVNPDDNLKTLLDQQTGGVFSKINQTYPDLKNKYISTSELSETLGETGDKTTKSSESVTKAMEDLQKKLNKIITDYLNGMDENRFTEDDNGNITTTLTKKDFVNLMKDFEKALGEDSVKKDVKAIAESQGSVTDFDEEYEDFRLDLADTIKDMQKEKNIKVSLKMSMKPGKDDKFESMTMKINAEDTESNTKLGGTFKIENVAFKKIPAFPKDDEIVSTDELQKIIQTVMIQSMYGDKDLSDSNF
ncbi:MULTISPECIES: hypothetical protein [Listeria]|uniref:Lmo2079 family surface lipoprotein n=1 Tax=Listeria TaxID=1637 RepID=UPI000B59219F|nr:MULTISPECIES: hypothetical protein [Listeria]